jgi:hypothetical protein
MKPPSSMAMEPQIGAPILTRWRRFLTWEKNIGVLKELKTLTYINSICRSMSNLFVKSWKPSPLFKDPRKGFPARQPLALWRETQRHHPTFSLGTNCFESPDFLYPDTGCLPFQRWIVSIFFYLFSLLSWLLTKRVSSICVWLTAACWKFQEVKSVASRACCKTHNIDERKQKITKERFLFSPHHPPGNIKT